MGSRAWGERARAMRRVAVVASWAAPAAAVAAAGGFRMSAEQGAPLDENLRLRDAPNVHLVSTAVFPRVGSSNPTHTILALAHRLAEQIRA